MHSRVLSVPVPCLVHSRGVVGGPSSPHPVHVHTPQASVALCRRFSSQPGALDPHPSPRRLRISPRSLSPSLRASSRAGRQISAPPGTPHPAASGQPLQTSAPRGIQPVAASRQPPQTTSAQRGIRPVAVSQWGLPTGESTGGLPRRLRRLMAGRAARRIRGETARRLRRLLLPRRPITLQVLHLLRPRKAAVRWEESGDGNRTAWRLWVTGGLKN